MTTTSRATASDLTTAVASRASFIIHRSSFIIPFASRASFILLCALLASCGGSPSTSGDAPGSATAAGKTKAEKSGGWGGEKGEKKDDPMPVEAMPVPLRTITTQVQASGSIQAFDTVRVTARVQGTLDQVLVSEGDQVSEGQSIAVIDGERYRLALAQAESQANRAATSRDIAKRNAERREELAKQDLVKGEELDQAKAQLAQAEADVVAAEVAVAKAKLDLRDATVLAPVAGVIQERLASRGAYLQVGTNLASLVQRDPLLVRFAVTVAEASRFSTGQAVTVGARGIEGDFPGVVSFIAAAADPATRLVTIQAKVTDPEHRLRPGAFATVRLTLPSRQAPSVPELALRASEDGLLGFVVEIGPGGSVLRQRVLTTGQRSGDGWVEISDGLTAGESVVVRAADGLRDGLKVTVVAPRFDPAGPVTRASGSGRGSAASAADLQSLGGN